MWAAVALRGISKNMKVAAAQRVVVSLRAQKKWVPAGFLGASVGVGTTRSPT